MDVNLCNKVVHVNKNEKLLMFEFFCILRLNQKKINLYRIRLFYLECKSIIRINIIKRVSYALYLLIWQKDGNSRGFRSGEMHM